MNRIKDNLMKRIAVIFTIILLIGIVSMALAQDATQTPAPTPNATLSLSDLATQIAINAAEAKQSAEDARNYAEDARNQVGEHMETANNLLGLFQNVTAISGIIIPLLAVVAGIVGVNRLNSAQKQLTATRKKVAKEMNDKQAELEAVRTQMEETTKLQQQNAANANLALSFLLLGERQYKAGDYAGTIETYKRALDLAPSSVVTHYRLGYVYIQSQKLEEAEYHLKAALASQADFAPALAAYGYAKRRLAENLPPGQEQNILLNEAEGLLLKALTMSPKLIDEDGEAWWGSLGGLYRRRNQIEQAIEAYKNASKATPQSSYAYGNLALLYARTENIASMLQTYERVEQLAWGEVQGNIDNYWGYADLLTSRLALGKIEKAEEALMAVLRTAPADAPTALGSLADTLQRLQSVLGEEKSNYISPFIETIRAHDAELAKARKEQK
jgi:tetratricopeptide (TPR) repeat protein